MKIAILKPIASVIFILCLIFCVVLGVGCSNRTGNNAAYKDAVEQALEQAELTDVSVAEDRDKNTITLGGTVHTDDAKAKAAQVAKGVAGDRIIVNEVSVRPVGAESDAKSMASDIDAGIEKNYKAALIAHHLNKQHIDFGAKNGVLTLKGSVETAERRQQAQAAASSVPNVQQVLNQIEVKR
jgi:osmotically-inducible protein OsmY